MNGTPRSAGWFTRVLGRVRDTVALVLQRGDPKLVEVEDGPPGFWVRTSLAARSPEVRRLRQWCVATPGVKLKWSDGPAAVTEGSALAFRLEVSPTVVSPGCLRPFLLGLRQLEHIRKLEIELEETNRGVLALYRETQNQRLAAGEASRRLADLNARKDEFLAMLAHELRNPLAALHAATAEIHRANGDGRRGLLAVMDRQLLLLKRLVDDLLDVSRVTRGRLVLTKTNVDLRRVLEDARASMEHAARQAEVRLEVEPNEGPAWVEGDVDRLVQIAVNLLDNAIKYTPPGGAVRCRVERGDEEVRLLVMDSGRGFNPAESERLFELFVQDVDANHAPKGLGLGLTLVRSLVRLHGGRIAARSPGVGQGSTFIVRLPRASEAAAPSSAPSPAEQQPQEGRCVLLVDDNEDLRMLFAVGLRRYFGRVDEAASGSEALEAVRDDHDVVVLDLGLPGLDGYEVARRIRSSGSRALLIALTGHGSAADFERSREAGFDDHLVKPVTPEAVVEAVTRRIDERSS